MATIENISTKMTYADYAAIPNDGCRHEIIDGEHYVNAAPNLYHQVVSKRLQYQLYTKIELAGLGTVFNAPCDVELSEHDIVQPDLLIVLNAHTDEILIPSRVKGVPDLLVEILSPSTIDHDRIRKRQLYQRVGVREYWIVDPAEQTLEQLVLKSAEYHSSTVREEVRPEFVDNVVINLEEVW